ncbi:hypothetical protein GOP47_0019045 [Adiantum capillus-veneris]|uniref:Uncharacterized protein n=1 Tax=Adiantum capillus-veneris TaxID=13818 RepID=A0A9D4UFQ8_ADICA|nr:hypothetical protein GOP47_0019045 [Adiantum capillus-veneris]
MIGTYAIKLDGSQKLDGCFVRLAGSSPKSTCAGAGVAARPLELSWKLFGTAMYTAEGRFYKPSKPMSFCPNAKKTTPSPKVSLPPLPFAKLSACTAQRVQLGHFFICNLFRFESLSAYVTLVHLVYYNFLTVNTIRTFVIANYFQGLSLVFM